MKCKGLLSLLGVLLALIGSVSSKRLKDRIYKDLKTSGFCFRRTNGTHEIGCSSDLNGNVGVVHLVSGSADLDWIAEKGPHAPYMAVFRPALFSHEALMRLRDSGRVSGVLLLLNRTSDDRPPRYSVDSACPNAVSSYYSAAQQQCSRDEPWNPAGSGTMFESFPFPIFLTNDESTVDEVLDCFDRFNKPLEDGVPRAYPLCAFELKAHMYSSTDTTTCLRRSAASNPFSPKNFCDEIADYNVMYFVNERNASEMDVNSEKVVVVSTQLDTFTMFDSNEFGADSPSTNIVALLETAALVAENKPALESGSGSATNVLFAFLNGEAFDYIGSGRMVYDMAEKAFPAKVKDGDFEGGHQPPLELEHVKEIITLGQLYNSESGEQVFAHTDNDIPDTDMIDGLKEEFSAQGLTLQDPSKKRGLPPSSIQSFLKKRNNIPGVHIADFDGKYTNQFFHGIFDSAKDNLGGYNYTHGTDQPVVIQIAKVSAAVANYLHKSLYGSNSRNIPDANRTRINEMLHCYTEKSDCTLFNASSNANTPPFYGGFPDGPLPQYVGVDMKNMFHPTFTRNLLAYLTAGEPVKDIDKPEDCHAPSGQNVYEYLFLKGEDEPANWTTGGVSCSESPACGHCYRTTTFRHLAKSPAYVIEGYDFADPNYSAWAESVWKVIGARMFLVESPAMQLAHFFAGLAVFLAGLGLSYWGAKAAPELFDAAAGESNSGSGTVATQESVLAAGVPGGDSEPTHL